MTADAPIELPSGVLDQALDTYGLIQRRRVKALYNLHRAVFAESLIGTLLPGADLSADPAHEFDLLWHHDGKKIKIEVKCSGEYLPRYGIEHRSPPSWEFPIQKRVWDSNFQTHVTNTAYQFDVLVLARHVGISLGAGWTFYVLNAIEAVEKGGRATARSLTAFPAASAGELARSVADAHQRLTSVQRSASKRWIERS